MGKEPTSTMLEKGFYLNDEIRNSKPIDESSITSQEISTKDQFQFKGNESQKK